MTTPPPEIETAKKTHLWFRRGFLTRMGWLSIAGTLGAATLALVRLMFPRAPIEAPTHFPVGRPSEFAVGSVTGRPPPDGRGRRVWVVRIKTGFYALLGRCTHLGCSPRWRVARGVFECPCHGSVFTQAGINTAGPAPRPLERVHITLDDKGRIVVDPSRRYRQEEGAWDDEGSFLTWGGDGDAVA